MSSLANALGDAAPPNTITHDGKVYKVGHLTVGVMAAMEKACLAAELEMLRGVLGDDDFRQAVEEAKADVRGGTYGFFKERTRAFMATAAGATRLSALLFGTTDAEAFALMQAKPAETSALLEITLGESLPKQGDADPNAPTAGR